MCGSPSQEIIISTDSTGETRHYSQAYGSSSEQAWYHGVRTYANPRAATWTGHDEVSGQRATADYFLGSNRYCA